MKQVMKKVQMTLQLGQCLQIQDGKMEMHFLPIYYINKYVRLQILGNFLLYFSSSITTLILWIFLISKKCALHTRLRFWPIRRTLWEHGLRDWETNHPRSRSSHAPDLGSRQSIRSLRSRHGDPSAHQLINLAAGDTTVGSTPTGAFSPWLSLSSHLDCRRAVRVQKGGNERKRWTSASSAKGLSRWLRFVYR